MNQNQLNYPLGSIILSNSATPNTYYGGQWTDVTKTTKPTTWSPINFAFDNKIFNRYCYFYYFNDQGFEYSIPPRFDFLLKNGGGNTTPYCAFTLSLDSNSTSGSDKIGSVYAHVYFNESGSGIDSDKIFTSNSTDSEDYSYFIHVSWPFILTSGSVTRYVVLIKFKLDGIRVNFTFMNQHYKYALFTPVTTDAAPTTDEVKNALQYPNYLPEGFHLYQKTAN